MGLIGLIEEYSGLNCPCKEEGISIIGWRWKAFCNSLKTKRQSINLVAIEKHWSYVMVGGGRLELCWLLLMG